LKGNIHLKEEVKPLGSTSRLYMREVSEQFKHIANSEDMRTVSKEKYALRNSLMITSPMRNSLCMWQQQHWRNR